MKALQLVTTPRPFFDQQVEMLERRGVECTVVSVPAPPNESRSLGHYLRFYPAVLDHVRRDYDVVHANYGLVAPFALAQPKRPVVVTLWGTDVMGENAWVRRVSRWSARAADAVILPTEGMARDYPYEHAVVPFGVDTSRFKPIDRGLARERVGWDRDERILLFPYDTSRPEKDYARARAVVERAAVDVELKTISGVPYEEMPNYVNASDALLVTSRRESGPMVVKEAAACNVPVVSTDVGFVREVLEGVSNSAVCRTDAELVAAVEEILEAPVRSDGREAVDGLELDAMGDGIARVYRHALEERGRRRPDNRAEHASRTNGRANS